MVNNFKGKNIIYFRKKTLSHGLRMRDYYYEQRLKLTNDYLGMKQQGRIHHFDNQIYIFYYLGWDYL